MKKKLLLAGAALLLAAAAVTGFSAYEESNISDLLDANVEALARNEDSMCTYDIVEINESKHKIRCVGEGRQCCIMN